MPAPINGAVREKSAATSAFDRKKARERVVNAAVVWAYDRSCAEAQMELEDAVGTLIGIEVRPDTPTASHQPANIPHARAE